MPHSSAILRILPWRRAAAADNMALDCMLLECAGTGGTHAFRAYGWETDALTFGYAQRRAEVVAALPPGLASAHCQRRPTGGGMVDHRRDWTYALVVAPASRWHRISARASYRCLHGLWRDAFAALGVATSLAPCTRDSCDDKAPVRNPATGKGDGKPLASAAAPPAACFAAPSADDLLNEHGRKIAGAAQKRTRQGLLIQGSMDPSALPGDLDRGTLIALFAEGLAASLNAQALNDPGLSLWNAAALTNKIRHFSSDAWNHKR